MQNTTVSAAFGSSAVYAQLVFACLPRCFASFRRLCSPAVYAQIAPFWLPFMLTSRRLCSLACCSCSLRRCLCSLHRRLCSGFPVEITAVYAHSVFFFKSARGVFRLKHLSIKGAAVYAQIGRSGSSRLSGRPSGWPPGASRPASSPAGRRAGRPAGRPTDRGRLTSKPSRRPPPARQLGGQ